jgi:integrase
LEVVMASVARRGNTYRIVFYFAGRKYQRTLGKCTQREAEALRSRVEANLHDLETGRLVAPEGVDLPLFLLSGGAAGLATVAPLTLSQLFQQYRDSLKASLEANSLDTIATHERHLTATLGASFAVASLSRADLQRHVTRRSAQTGRYGRKVSPVTTKKEITTFGAAWTWAVGDGGLSGEFPSRGLVYPKGTEKTPFATYDALVKKTAGLSSKKAAELWACLFLTLPEVAELLGHVATYDRKGWVYPMFCLAAHTGMRRSEMLRAHKTDYEHATGTFLIRELKKNKAKRTTRVVPVSPFLAGVLDDWLGRHPGGPYLFCDKTLDPVTVDGSNHHFGRAVAGSRWRVMAGWHVLRHSFASNCAAAGVDQRLINEWMGHQTEEMVRRYRHLIPGQARGELHRVFGTG